MTPRDTGGGGSPTPNGRPKAVLQLAKDGDTACDGRRPCPECTEAQRLTAMVGSVRFTLGISKLCEFFC